MKIRTSFVSNSSSSSYICDVSGEAFEVMDGDLESSGLSQCANGHIFKSMYLVSFKPEYPSPKEMLRRLVEVTDSKRECQRLGEMSEADLKLYFSNKFYNLESDGSVDIRSCPICSMTQINPADLTSYLLKKLGKSKEEVLKDIKREFDNFGAFRRYIANS